MRQIITILGLAVASLLMGCGKQETEMPVVFQMRPPEVYIPQEATSQVCQVHGKVRTNATVRVAYGFPGDRGAAYYDAERTVFPNSWRYIHAGCVFITVNGQSSPTQAVASVCYSCRQAEDRWLREHEK